MVSMNEQDNDSLAVLMLQLFVIILIFAVPTVILAMALPKYASWIILGGTYLLFALAALFAGIGWREPAYSLHARIYTLLVFAFTILAMPVYHLVNGDYWDFDDFVQGVLVRGAVVLTPFVAGLIGSWMMRRYVTPSGKCTGDVDRR
ncbi:MAG: hypothetical protein ABFD54_01060 [Armatimonadota bacterium]|nr:hypothetical protein [bacterium]